MRQYIGARYVPKFYSNPNGSNDWESGVEYESLTIVKYGNNVYTSKKTVPSTVGSPNLNPEYWVLTGNNNNGYTELRQAIDNVASDVDTLETTVDTISDDVDNIKESVSLLPRKYIFIGDSYNTTDVPTGGVAIVPWSSLVATYLGLVSSEYYNSGVSGAGFVSGTTFRSQLVTLSESISNKNEITDIVVLGGINDGNVSADLVKTAVIEFGNYCKQYYPNAIVTVGMISWASGNADRIKLRTLKDCYSVADSRENMRSIGNAYMLYHACRSYSQPDGHPNESGSIAIAKGVANFLKGGNTSICHSGSGTMLKNSGNLPLAIDLNNLQYEWCADESGFNVRLYWETGTINNIDRTVVQQYSGSIGQVDFDYSRPFRLNAEGFGFVHMKTGPYRKLNYLLRITDTACVLEYNLIGSAEDSYSFNVDTIQLSDPNTVSLNLLNC